jgi:endonuclease/exonuclease/phosphatase family metal-dependent hydrolase
MSFRDLRTRWQSLRSRRLAFEALECRDLLAVLRIVDYNTLNGPNGTDLGSNGQTDHDNFKTILQGISNETVQGNTRRVDILALQETDPPGGGDSIGQLRDIMDEIAGTPTYASIYSEFSGGDSTGIVYDTSSVTLLQQAEIGTGNALTHVATRAKFQPVGGAASTVFYVYSVHLKSGTGGAEATTRGTEAAYLRADVDSLGEGAQVVFVGDFNMNGSSEAAWSNFTTAGVNQPGQLQDVANQPGEWSDNAAFKLYHSQDPRLDASHFGMDDRFDIQFATGELFDGVGVDYVPNSFHIFGNNGTHTLNQAITTGFWPGTSLPEKNVAMLDALVAASDHLPAVGDYQIVSVVPNVRVTQTLGSTKVVEGGLYDTYQVVLDTVPTANVTVTVQPVNTPSPAQLDVGNGAGGALQLTFTPANALTPQTVVVRAVNDSHPEGDHSRAITHTSVSADAAYNGLSIPSVNVAIVDNDAPKIVINEVDSDTPATPTNDDHEFIELYDGGVGNFNLTGYSVVLFNGGAAGNPSYLAVDLSGKFTNAQGFYRLGNPTVVPVSESQFPTNTLQNGPDGIGLYYGVVGPIVTGTFPTSAQLSGKLKDAIVYDTSDADDTDLINDLNPGHAQFDEDEPNGSGDVLSISRIPDGGTPFDTSSSSYATQAPTPGTFNQAQPFGYLLLQSAGRLDVQEGGATDSYQLALLSIPTFDVQITIDPDSQTYLNNAAAGAPIVLTFTTANALIPQTITVTAVDDVNIEGNHNSILHHTVASSDTQYNGLSIPDLTATIVDNDVAQVTITEIMYNPTDESGGVGEWIEVVNTGTSPVNLAGWKFDDEDSTNWGAVPSILPAPSNAPPILNPNQVAVFYDAAFATDSDQFKSAWSVPDGVLLIPVSWGNLSNGPNSPTDEVVQLLDNVNVQKDVVKYDDNSPWPTGASTFSIYLKSLSLDNNNGANWAKSSAGTAKAVSGTGIAAGDTGSPGRFFLGGDYSNNSYVDIADYVMWRKTQNQTVPTGSGADGSGVTFGVPDGSVNQFDYVYWRANFGFTGAQTAPPLDGSELAATSTLGEPVVADVSEPQPAAALKNESAVDTAITQISPVTATSTVTTSLSPVVRSTSSAASSFSSDDLLLALQPAMPSHSGDFGSGSMEFASDQDAEAIDELFASLDDFAATAGVTSSVL